MGTITINGQVVGEITDLHADPEFFKAHAVTPSFKLSFDQIPDAEKTWLDRVADAAEHAEDCATWLRDPYSWPNGWRRVAMVTFPIAFIVWLGALLALILFAVGLDLFVRVAQWIDMGITNFDGWWRRKDPEGKAYTIEFEGDSLDDLKMTGFRKS